MKRRREERQRRRQAQRAAKKERARETKRQRAAKLAQGFTPSEQASLLFPEAGARALVEKWRHAPPDAFAGGWCSDPECHNPECNSPRCSVCDMSHELYTGPFVLVTYMDIHFRRHLQINGEHFHAFVDDDDKDLDTMMSKVEARYGFAATLMVASFITQRPARDFIPNAPCLELDWPVE